MRAFLTIIAAACVMSTNTIAQTSQKQPKTLSLNGCVEHDSATPDQYTLTEKDGTKYRVTGKDFREFLGRRVQLDGGVVIKGLKISGGLQPNPNVAAQAGALDPARAAVMAATSGPNQKPTTEVPEFRVKTITPTGGSCQ